MLNQSAHEERQAYQHALKTAALGACEPVEDYLRLLLNDHLQEFEDEHGRVDQILGDFVAWRKRFEQRGLPR
jgi:hypothetical protein